MPDEVMDMVRTLPDKQCSSDPLPMRLLKTNVELLAPFLSWLFCWSLERGIVPSCMKSAYIMPILKKTDMDPANTKSYRVLHIQCLSKSYRPITNLSMSSKLLERLVSKQLVTYLKDNTLLPDRQSAYRAHHSTETSVLRVLADILLALDTGNLAVLTLLLDLSAAFDSVNKDTLLRWLQISYGLGGVVINWFTSYLSGRSTPSVRSSVNSSIPSAVLYGVPQGLVLGPILFLLYMADLLQLVRRHNLHPHAYADDMQIYGFCDPPDANALSERLSLFIDDVSPWMMVNRLQLNSAKTEVLWCSSARRQYQIPTSPVRVGDTSVLPLPPVSDLGIYTT